MNGRLFILIVILGIAPITDYAVNADPFGWSNPSQNEKPWARWWWLGSAVTEDEITRQLEQLSDAGFGGVEIQPIYPAENSPIEPITFLSERWASMLKHTIQEGERLGMGVDITLGSGWPFGGPWLEREHAARRMIFKRKEVTVNEKQVKIMKEEGSGSDIACVVIQAKGKEDQAGKVLEIMEDVGQQFWLVPKGEWIVYEFQIGYTGQKVKRATVGSEGPVLDHFSQEAFNDYVQPFEQVLQWIGDISPRSNFNDSFEVYGANWTPDLLEEFKKRRGYDLKPYLPLLAGKQRNELKQRVSHDYRLTVQELFHEDFCQSWRDWSRRQEMNIRFQAHGSPGHLLDLYAMADIPETEGFGRGGIEIEAAKMASSAAHLYGKGLCSSETFTWLDEHFQITLDAMRRSVDEFFLADINHVFYHGVPFSPQSVPFPGWLFYASTNSGEHTTWFKHLDHLNNYITRIQSVLQKGQFDGDVLLFYPIHDLFIYDKGDRNWLQYCTIHNTKNWLSGAAKPTYETAQWLWNNGIQYDYASERLVQNELSVEKQMIKSSASHYNVLIFAGCQSIELDTYKHIISMAEKGGKVIFIGGQPDVVPDNNDPSDNETSLPGEMDRKINALIKSNKIKVLNTLDELKQQLKEFGVKSEQLNAKGFDFVRRCDDENTYYYVKYRGDKRFEGWVPLVSEGKEVVIGDPLTGNLESTHSRNRNGFETFLTLEPGRTQVIAVGDTLLGSSTPSDTLDEEKRLSIEDPWQLQWTDQEQKQRKTKRIDNLTDWTEFDELRYFSGTVTYRTDFTLDPSLKYKEIWLNLNQLYETAEVYVNGKYAGFVWTKPHHLDIQRYVKPGSNQLRLEITNLPANRIIKMDREKIDWKKFYFVNIDYKPFDASNWEPLPSGLLGPVELIIRNE